MYTVHLLVERDFFRSNGFGTPRIRRPCASVRACSCVRALEIVNRLSIRLTRIHGQRTPAVRQTVATNSDRAPRENPTISQRPPFPRGRPTRARARISHERLLRAFDRRGNCCTRLLLQRNCCTHTRAVVAFEMSFLTIVKSIFEENLHVSKEN